MDCSLNALEKARDRLDADGLPYQGVRCCLTQLPFKAHSFDAVVDVVSSAHNEVDGIRQIILEVYRVLKPNGKLFSVLPTNRCSRRTFKGFTTTFLEDWEVELLLMPYFTQLQILRSTYHLEPDCKIDLWITTGVTKELSYG